MVASLPRRPALSEPDPILGLLDDLVRLAQGSTATSIEVEAAEFSVTVTRDSRAAEVSPSADGPRAAVAEPEKLQRVHATAVGIFSSAREWTPGDAVDRGTVLGAIQSLGHMAEIVAPAPGKIEEVLVAGGAPVEYGQPLFAIALG